MSQKNSLFISCGSSHMYSKTISVGFSTQEACVRRDASVWVPKKGRPSRLVQCRSSRNVSAQCRILLTPRSLNQTGISESFQASSHDGVATPFMPTRSSSRFRSPLQSNTSGSGANLMPDKGNAKLCPKPCLPHNATIKCTCTCSLIVSSRTAFSSLLVFISTVSTTSESSFLRSLAASSVNLWRRKGNV